MKSFPCLLYGINVKVLNSISSGTFRSFKRVVRYNLYGLVCGVVHKEKLLFDIVHKLFTDFFIGKQRAVQVNPVGIHNDCQIGNGNSQIFQCSGNIISYLWIAQRKGFLKYPLWSDPRKKVLRGQNRIGVAFVEEPAVF